MMLRWFRLVLNCLSGIGLVPARLAPAILVAPRSLMASVRKFLFVGLVFATSLSVAETAPNETLSEESTSEKTKDWIYTIRPDDSLWALCKSYSKEPDCWLKLVKYNKLATPKDIPPGTRIKIPQRWLKDTAAKAEAVSVEGEVHKLEVQTQIRSPLEVGDLLAQNDQVRSLNGNATLEFSDGSQMFLKSNSLVQLETLTFNDAEQISNTRVRLDKGRLRNLIKKQRSVQSTYEVATPAAVAAVRGTDFRVTLTDDEPPAMLTEVTEGTVAVAAGDKEFILEKGFAIRAVEGEALTAPVQLLPRPTLSNNSQQTLSFPYEFSWLPLDGAVSYRVSVYGEESLLFEKMISETQIILSELPSGKFQLLVRGVDANGIEGRDRRFLLNIQ